MQALVEVEENQLKKLLFYTDAKNITEAIGKVIADYLIQKESVNAEKNNAVLLQKKHTLKIIQQRFSTIPPEMNLSDELIAERRLEAKQELS